MTPNLAVVRIENPRWLGMRLWLPLFLLWIPVILLSPILLLVVWAACFLGRISFWRAIATFWTIVCSLPGTDVRVCADGKRITVRIL